MSVRTLRNLSRFIVSMLLLVASIPAVAACRPVDAPATDQRVLRVRRAEVFRDVVTPRITVFGTLVHRNKAEVYAEAEGVLQELLVEQGDEVAADELLGRLRQDRLVLRHSRALAAVEQARAAYELAAARQAGAERRAEGTLLELEAAEQEVTRRRRAVARGAEELYHTKQLLAVDGATPQRVEQLRGALHDAETTLSQTLLQRERLSIGYRDQDLQAAGRAVPAETDDRRAALIALNTEAYTAEVAVARARLGEVKAELREIELLLTGAELRSPINGVVADRHLDIGERVAPTQAVFSVINTNELYLQVELDEREHALVSPGQPARVTVDLPDRPVLAGRIATRAPYVNAHTRTGRARILLLDPGAELAPGVFARAAIEVGPPREQVFVPDAALRDRELDPHLYILSREGEEARVFRHPVTVLADVAAPEGSRAVSGVDPGAEVIVHPATFAFRDGTTVEVIE